MVYDNYSYRIPEGKRYRLLMDSDAANEADDPFAIAHGLLSPKFDNRGIIAAHFGTVRSKNSMEDSYCKIKTLLGHMGFPAKLAYRGADGALEGKKVPFLSEGGRKIIEEAMRTDTEEALFVVFMGPLTDMAQAYLTEPAIAKRLTCIWIGGGKYPEGGFEYNLSNDILAANIVMESDIPLWQIPRDVYSEVIVSMAELECRVKKCGELGKYLFEQLEECSHTPASMATNRTGEFWCLGDSPAIGVLLLEQLFGYHWGAAPFITKDMMYVEGRPGRQIKIYERVNTRYILEDFYAKLALFSRAMS